MARKFGVLVLGIVTMIALTGGSAHAAGSKCASGKFKGSAKKVSAKAKCYGKAATKGGTVVQACLDKAELKFASAFTKAETSADCLASTPDAPTIEGKIDSLVEDIVRTVAGSPGGSFTGNKCDGKKITAAGKKASGKAMCEAKAAGKGVPVVASCLTKAEGKFTKAITKAEGGTCTHTGQAATLEGKVDAFFDELTRELTHTLPPGPKLQFTSVPGTTSCGSAALAAPPLAPFDGEIDSDTAGTTKISDLGLGCLYIGGGNAVFNPSGASPDGGSTFFELSGGSTLLASLGTGPSDCSKGVSSTKHCINDGTNDQCTAATTPYPCCTGAGTGTCPRDCATDVDCMGAGSGGACQPDANCFFGPPQPNKSGPLSTCVLNVIASDASGTVNTATGDVSTSMLLSSRVFVTGNATFPCPGCVSGACNAGPNAGKPCTAVGTLLTSPACPATTTKYVATIPVNLAPLTTGASITTDAGGNFCPSQAHPGAFGKPLALAIKQTGTPAGDLTDMNPHGGVLAYPFCIPSTGSAGVDAIADLPGPGALGLNSVLQLH